MARSAGAVEVRTASEEFTAAMLGWPVRTFEAAVPPGRLGWGWAKFAFNSWTTLSWVDANVWRKVVPKGKSSELDDLTIASSELCQRALTMKYLTDEQGNTCYDYYESTETQAS